MKLNSINTYNQSMKAKSNPNFGMAKFANPETIVELSKSFNPHYVSKIISDVKSTGCKNSIIGLIWNSDIGFGTYVDGLTLSFPNQSQRIVIYDEAIKILKGKGTNLSHLIPKAEKNLVKNIIYKAAQKGELDKTKTELLENLPELTEIIRKESNRSEILEINSAAKKILQKQKEQQQKIAQQIENYKKEHPILSKFYIPKFK